jgi:peptide deformylase
VRQIVKDMAQTMYEAPGIGLAATQVNIHQQIIVIDLSDERDQLQVFINPELVWASEEKKVWQEGCLSVPDFFDEVLRPAEVKVKALDVNGQPFEIHADGLMAVCIQHEMDHLKGKVFVEYLSSLKRMRIAGKLKKKAKTGVI